MKLGEVVVPMDTTTSPSFIKIGLKTKKFWYEPFSGCTFECAVNNTIVEVHSLSTTLSRGWAGASVTAEKINLAAIIY